MKTGYVVALVLAAFAVGALVTSAVASGGAGGMMSGWTQQEMFDFCRSMMGASAP